MNWLPSRNMSGKVTARNNRLINNVVFRYLRHSFSTGGYSVCVKRETGFSDSGRSLPLMNITINTGTSVIASSDENPTASVFVQASGRNMRPSWASSKNTGRNETTMIRSEKNNAGPTCLAASINTLRRSVSGTVESRLRDELLTDEVTNGPFDVSGPLPAVAHRSDKCR